ncbi:MAG: hypothetical protein IR164_16700 [Devosia sp.]|jgi:hypothetical protein|uniref:hypothetical protein n=1 Tax=Devosia sp. TaxID=1871048 RepID=UPI0019DFFA93|nr:hypothetical protein [Devosia sp.]MBF0680566.1 hypothetical protein [Devosia sp.]
MIDRIGGTERGKTALLFGSLPLFVKLLIAGIAQNNIKKTMSPAEAAVSLKRGGTK